MYTMYLLSKRFFKTVESVIATLRTFRLNDAVPERKSIQLCMEYFIQNSNIPI